VAMPTAEGERALKPGEWNDFEVSAQGNHIVTQLNGVKIVEFSRPGVEIHRGRDWFADSYRRRREDAVEGYFCPRQVGSGGCTCPVRLEIFFSEPSS